MKQVRRGGGYDSISADVNNPPSDNAKASVPVLREDTVDSEFPLNKNTSSSEVLDRLEHENSAILGESSDAVPDGSSVIAASQALSDDFALGTGAVQVSPRIADENPIIFFQQNELKDESLSEAPQSDQPEKEALLLAWIMCSVVLTTQQFALTMADTMLFVDQNQKILHHTKSLEHEIGNVTNEAVVNCV